MKQEELSESTKQLHEAAKMRVEDLFADSQTETGDSLSLELKQNIQGDIPC